MDFSGYCHYVYDRGNRNELLVGQMRGRNFLAVEFRPNECISLIYLGVQCLAFALFLPQMDRDCLDDCSLTQSHYHSLHNQTF